MKQSLQLKLGQQLAMTPQLQQAIKLLQLSTLDLEQEIQQAVENNPFLELQEDDTSSDSTTDNEETTEEQPAVASDFEPEINQQEQLVEQISTVKEEHDEEPKDTSQLELSEQPTQQDQIPDDLPVDSAWEDIYPQGSSGSAEQSDDDYDFESRNSQITSLQDQLIWQLNLTNLSPIDKAIGMALIDSMNPSGYLITSLAEITESLNSEADLDEEDIIEEEQVESILHFIQHFDPAGVGARNLQECLMIQAKQLPASTPMRREACDLIREYLPLLAKRDYSQLMRKTKLKEKDLAQAILLIQSLDPKPGQTISQSNDEYVIPDVVVTKKSDRWHVELNQDSLPKLRLNQTYADLVKKGSGNSSDANYMKSHLQEARWFIKSIKSRNETLLRVASKIVEHQQAFLEQGPEAMRPLILHDIAQAVEMHESTISRVTTQKFMATPQGVFELKYFFSSHVSTDSGGECSSTAIRALIKKLIAEEDSRKPLSDSKIAQALAGKGIRVARRTIAKYRESLCIPPSNERKKLV